MVGVLAATAATAAWFQVRESRHIAVEDIGLVSMFAGDQSELLLLTQFENFGIVYNDRGLVNEDLEIEKYSSQLTLDVELAVKKLFAVDNFQ